MRWSAFRAGGAAGTVRPEALRVARTPPADAGRVSDVLETKAYIDMPNQGYLNFLNPRNVFFGVRISL